ncbi:MAG: endo-1,4-beta-xylanase [Chitinophagales bacterium]
MKYIFFLFSCTFCFFQANAQDTYHNYLLTYLQNDYNVSSSGEWVFFDNETAIINDADSYGAASSTLNVLDQPFSKKVRFQIGQAGANPWDAGWNLRSNIAVQSGDVVLAVFYLRSENGSGEANFFVENATNYTKEMYLSLPVGTDWRRYLIPFAAVQSYATSGLTWGFHLAMQSQTIEIAGFTAINFKRTLTVEDLPNETNNQFYEGYEEDAPWRTVAAQRIEQLRKANINLTITNTNGQAVENVPVQVKMLQHEFNFGSAITANKIAGNNAQNVIYENKLINLDGKGHGFNTVVFENDLKWPAWEDEWFVNKTELVNAVQWLRNKSINIRGHNLVWPGNDNYPSDLNSHLNDLPYIQNRINNHIETVLTYPGIAGEIDEWDVLNEIVTNTTLAERFRGSEGYPTGRELYVDIFNKAREMDTNTGLWLNDYITISQNQSAGSPQYDQLKQYVQELVDAGVDIEGIGFQAHIGGAPTGISDVLATLDDFYNTFGLKAKITEFDMPSFVSEELGATYLRDFMTAIFGHPSVDGFLFWNFWDGATWLNGGTNLYRMDWSPTPSRDTFVDLLFNEWWTDEQVISSSEGLANSRIFKGLYEISYICNGETVRDTVQITDTFNYTISCDNLTTNTKDFQQQKINVYPNPSHGSIHIELPSNTDTTLRLFDLSGKKVLETRGNSDYFTLETNDLKGIYFLEMTNGEAVFVEKIMIE